MSCAQFLKRANQLRQEEEKARRQFSETKYENGEGEFEKGPRTTAIQEQTPAHLNSSSEIRELHINAKGR